MVVTLIEPPTLAAIDISQAREQCSILDDAHDNFLYSAIAAATSSMEKELSSRLMQQTVKITIDGFVDDEALALPVYPVQSITEFQYYDAEETPQTLAQDTDFWPMLAGLYPCLAPVSDWPATSKRPGAIEITAVVGYIDRSLIPASVTAAMLMRVNELFTQRGESVTGASTEATTLSVAAMTTNDKRLAT